MENRPAVHPSADTLQAFALGKIDDFRAESLVAHVANCSACQKAAAAMSSDGFLERLRAAHSRSGTPAPTKPLSGLAQSFRDGAVPVATPVPVSALPPELIHHPQYEIVRELGRGGMGVVYLARNKLLARLEVLKVVNKSLLEKPGVADRFLREIQAAAQLNHPNVVTAYSALPLGGSLAFAMEYVDGEDLAKLMKARGSLPVAYACYCAREAALGLQHAHEKKMVHRDIKPQNLILARDGVKHIVKVLDFGLAKVLREGGNNRELTGTGVMMGTPDYMAPEQMMNAALADIRADIYSLGCTLYYLLAGEPPFDGDNLYAILHAHQSVEARALNLVRAEIPAELAEVVRKMMAKAPEQRYQTPGEVARALAPFIKQKAVGVPVGASQLVDRKAVVAPPGTKPPMKAAMPPAAIRVDTVGSFGSTSADARKANAAKQAAPAKPSSSRKWLLAGAAGALGLLLLLALLGAAGLWAAGVFKLKTKDGTIVLENLPPDAEVTVDGGTVSVKASEGNTFEVRLDPAKKHRLEVKKSGFKVFGEEIEIDAGGRKSVIVRLVREEQPGGVVKPAEDKEKSKPIPEDQEKWVSLFNGKDLKGWSVEYDDPKVWTVEDGVIVAHGTNMQRLGYLLTDREYGDFIMRLEFNLDDHAASGVVLRAVPGELLPHPLGGRLSEHPVFMLEDQPERSEVTGTLHWLLDSTHVRPNRPAELSPPNKWNKMEIEMKGRSLRVSVNGKPVTDTKLAEGVLFKDGTVPALNRPKGRIGLLKSFRSVRFRNIEIKELAPTKPDGQGFAPLFNGKDLTGWTTLNGQPARWAVRDGYVEVTPGAGGDIRTKQQFGPDFKLHVEFWLPLMSEAKGQARANSGIFLQGRYEVQILDSYMNDTFANGSIGALYGLIAPDKEALAKALRPPEQWQTYDIDFHAPHVDEQGKVTEKGRITLVLNGVTVIDDGRFDKVSGSALDEKLGTPGPIRLQDHGNTVRFRKIEIKELPASK